MYAIQVDHIVYDRHRDGRPITLVDALRGVYGVGNARVLRADGTPVVNRAGSSVGPLVHCPSGRSVARRPYRGPRVKS